jgi:outer membrane protein assembly factor BamB
MGGPADQQVIDGVVQEIDIATGKVLFQWNSADHVPYRDSHAPLPPAADRPWDWFHINAVHLDTDGNLLVSSRNTWTVYKVNRHTGKIMWELGGKQSSFTLKAVPGQVNPPPACLGTAGRSPSG